MRRREMLLASSCAALVPSCAVLDSRSSQRAAWYGFNLLEKFTHSPAEWQHIEPAFARANEPYRETDFDLIAGLGFNYVRLPLSYRCWMDPREPERIYEQPMREIEQAIRWAQQRRLHITLNLHRAPGYCINQANAPEPWNLWAEEVAQDLFVRQWTYFARRLHTFPPTVLSFHLLNEPSRCTLEQYEALMDRTVGAIRSVDPQRTILLDGLFGEAILPAEGLAGIPNTVQVTRGYAPFRLTHYRAGWGGEAFEEVPAWPMTSRGVTWNDDVFRTWCIEPYAKLSRAGKRVLVGEFGCYNKTPHTVTLQWMERRLADWKQEGWGWALWNLRGPFGIFESNRADVKYETYQGLAMDRKMLELLQSGSAHA
jgi:endoglucanase